MRLTQYLNEKTIIAYHGSYDQNIKKFTTHKRDTETGITIFGAYFSNNPEVAETFGNDALYKVKLNFRKLIDLTKWAAMKADENFVKAIPELSADEIKRYLEWDYRGFNSPYNVLENLDGKYDLLKRWMKAGYDGIAFNEEHFSKKGITYVPFYERQIKIISKTEV